MMILLFGLITLALIYAWCDLAGRWFDFTFKLNNFAAFMTGQAALCLVFVAWVCYGVTWFGLV